MSCEVMGVEEQQARNLCASYSHRTNTIKLDINKLGKLVAERLSQAEEAGTSFADPELVWVAKFSSLISHEIIYKVINDLEGIKTSRKFDKLRFHEFMEKLPNNMPYIVLWSDAFETCPIGDTWFNTLGPVLAISDSLGILAITL